VAGHQHPTFGYMLYTGSWSKSIFKNFSFLILGPYPAALNTRDYRHFWLHDLSFVPVLGPVLAPVLAPVRSQT